MVRLFKNPFAVLPTNVDSCFQLELIELLASIFKVARFAQGVQNSRVLFTNSWSFRLLKENAAIMLTVFDSTYICEQTFSQIKIAKSKI